MAIFSTKSDKSDQADKALQAEKAPKIDEPKVAVGEPKVATETAAATSDITAVVSRNGVLIIPRLSEKSSAMNKLNKYVFKVEGKINKVELRKAIERTYGATVIGINMITVNGKSRRSGRVYGRTSGFKKAIVTLSPKSKKIDTLQA